MVDRAYKTGDASVDMKNGAKDMGHDVKNNMKDAYHEAKAGMNERKAEDAPADVGLERPEHGVEFPQADQREQEQQAEKVRPGKVEGGSKDAHKHRAGGDPRKMF